jgi:transaldolase
VGVTTNPSIFSAAISGAAEYAADIALMKQSSVDEVVKKLTTDDVRQACDLFIGIYESSKGVDGRVSIEVDPRLAHDTERTIAAGKELWAIIDRPNLMIKVPATLEGLPAITALLAAGISVNVTLIFSVKRYGQVIEAYMKGIEQCEDPSTVHSVASFFISRIDSSIDALLKKNGSTDAIALLGKAAIANAHLAYQLFEEKFASVVRGNTISAHYADAVEVLKALSALGISLDQVTTELEIDGVKKFAQAWDELLENVKAAQQG